MPDPPGDSDHTRPTPAGGDDRDARDGLRPGDRRRRHGLVAIGVVAVLAVIAAVVAATRPEPSPPDQEVSISRTATDPPPASAPPASTLPAGADVDQADPSTAPPTADVAPTNGDADAPVEPDGTADVVVGTPDGGEGTTLPPVILDTDANNELDDQYAIAYLLLSEAFEPVGITVNRTELGGGIDEHVAEARRVVALVDRTADVPVVPGASGSFEQIVMDVQGADFDGRDAVEFIIETATERAEPLLVVAIGKLTNVALAVARDPGIADDLRVLWLGSNYPDTGPEYNQQNDPAALQFLLASDVPLEIAVVRIGRDDGTAAVTVTPDENRANLAGAGPSVDPPVVGRRWSPVLDVRRLRGVTRRLGATVRRPSVAFAVRRRRRRRGDRAHLGDLDGDRRPRSWSTARWSTAPTDDRRIIVWDVFDRDAIIGDLFETIREGADYRPRASGPMRGRRGGHHVSHQLGPATEPPPDHDLSGDRGAAGATGSGAAAQPPPTRSHPSTRAAAGRAARPTTSRRHP